MSSKLIRTNQRFKMMGLAVVLFAGMFACVLFFQGRVVRAWKLQEMRSQIAGSGIELSDTAPGIEGSVRAVNRESRLAVLSLPGDHRIREGDQFIITRKERLVAILKVIKVQQGLAGAQVIFTVVGESILVGDRASTSP